MLISALRERLPLLAAVTPLREPHTRRVELVQARRSHHRWLTSELPVADATGPAEALFTSLSRRGGAADAAERCAAAHPAVGEDGLVGALARRTGMLLRTSQHESRGSQIGL